MIEVRSSAPASQLGAVSASSKGAVEARTTGGNKLPVSADKVQQSQDVDETSSAQSQAAKEPEVDLNKMVASINDYVQTIHRDLQFTVDEDLERTVIKVVDGDSGELIRQIPEEVFLELARKLKEDGELRLMNALG
ncbi:flagellar protein FlaG [Teredinibacter turnerae]|uniref:FlaG protein n=1 Tax=Teredinibacter turnerae (strain ATCC 39867 / T7901) TaxID=377629 RepID=C5BRZ3_TERTT|nr:flagellar protein FlaG [Teredinibacter turnerae]ACR11312.1 FlaG protein [Teredinibacter turnerae T7901]